MMMLFFIMSFLFAMIYGIYDNSLFAQKKDIVALIKKQQKDKNRFNFLAKQ